MIPHDSVLVQLVRLIDRLPVPASSSTPRRRGRPIRLLRRPLPQGACDHDRKAPCTRWASCSRFSRSPPTRCAPCASCSRSRGPLPLQAHLRAQASRPARELARADRLPGTPPGRAAKALGENGAGRGHRLHRASGQGRVWHKKDRRPAWCPIPPSTPRRAGPSPAGTGGSTAGSCTWRARWPGCGYRSPRSLPPPTSHDSRIAPLLIEDLPERRVSCLATSTTRQGPQAEVPREKDASW